MSLPHSQLAELHKGLAAHERRVAQLREGVRLAREEEGFHKLLIDFVQNDRTIKVLNELHDRADLMEEIADDPMGYCRERGIPLPDGVTVAMIRDGVAVTLRHGRWEMVIGWKSKTGVFAEPPKGPAASLSPRFMSSVDPESAAADVDD
jgi:hypothetical protein